MLDSRMVTVFLLDANKIKALHNNKTKWLRVAMAKCKHVGHYKGNPIAFKPTRKQWKVCQSGNLRIKTS